MKSKKERQFELAKILLESGMDLPVVSEITGLDGAELLYQRIVDDKDENKEE